MLVNWANNLLVATIILICVAICGADWMMAHLDPGFAAGVEAGVVGTFGAGLFLTTIFHFLSKPNN